MSLDKLAFAYGSLLAIREKTAGLSEPMLRALQMGTAGAAGGGAVGSQVGEGGWGNIAGGAALGGALGAVTGSHMGNFPLRKFL